EPRRGNGLSLLPGVSHEWCGFSRERLAGVLGLLAGEYAELAELCTVPDIVSGVSTKRSATSNAYTGRFGYSGRCTSVRLDDFCGADLWCRRRPRCLSGAWREPVHWPRAAEQATARTEAANAQSTDERHETLADGTGLGFTAGGSACIFQAVGFG